MNLWESVSVALNGLKANKMRSGLTMLGVIIGVMAVIAMVAIGQGARQQTMDRIQSLGTNVLMINSGQMRTGAVRGGMGSNQTMTLEDAEAIKKECPAVGKVAPEVRSSLQVKYKNQNTNTTIFGTTPDYLEVRSWKVAEGRFFTNGDVKSSAKVGCIAQTTATTLFGRNSPVNKSVRIGGIGFKIIGLMAAKGSGSSFGDADDQIFIPISTAMRRVMGVQRIRGISAQAVSMDKMTEANDQIDKLLRKRHRIASNDEADFSIRNQEEFMETADATSQTFTLLLAGIASVSLLVGGIGIMNIMLVSVTERTREIGLRKAVGARRRDILLQFLIEAIVLSLVGGTLGIAFGIGGSMLLAKLSGWMVVISVQSIVIAFLFAAVIGVFFGLYPARRAASLDPIEALRYE